MPSAVPQFFGQVRQVMTGGTVTTMNVGDSNPVHYHYPSKVHPGYIAEPFPFAQARPEKRHAAPIIKSGTACTSLFAVE